MNESPNSVSDNDGPLDEANNQSLTNDSLDSESISAIRKIAEQIVENSNSENAAALRFMKEQLADTSRWSNQAAEAGKRMQELIADSRRALELTANSHLTDYAALRKSTEQLTNASILAHELTEPSRWARQMQQLVETSHQTGIAAAVEAMDRFARSLQPPELPIIDIPKFEPTLLPKLLIEDETVSAIKKMAERMAGVSAIANEYAKNIQLPDLPKIDKPIFEEHMRQEFPYPNPFLSLDLKAAEEKAKSAAGFYERIKAAIEDKFHQLKEGEKLVLLYNSPNSGVYQVINIGYRQPQMITLKAVDSEGGDEEILMHMNCLQIIMKVIPPQGPEQKKPVMGFLGFLPDE